MFNSLKANWLIILIIGFFCLGTLGASLKYLEDDARREIARRESRKGFLNEKNEESLLNSINPFLPAPLPAPTPQLSKEYIYAGQKLLAVEDAGANSAPPADLAVWRPSNGTWYVLGGQGSQQTIQGWGTNEDDPVEGDYDGDGKTDFSIFRPSTNTWWILKSSDGGYYSITLGTSGDKPAPADYDGDGKTDIAVFRPSTGIWYINQSSNSQTIQYQFGLSTDTPAPADYDGDGKADIGVWRDSNTTFYSLRSSNGGLAINALGVTGDIPVSSDYDGDGKADYALFRNSTATWYIKQSTTNSIQQLQWGITDDKLVQNDYDGDGKRVKKVCNTEIVIFVYDAAGKLVAEYSTQLSTTPQTQYQTNDHLGTPRINTNELGAVVSRSDYLPYGEEINGLGNRSSAEKYVSDDVRQGFTGYIKDDETGLDFAQARMYKKELGRFTGADPLLSSGRPNSPQTWNKFTYVLNNPLVQTDPFGLYECKAGKTKCEKFDKGVEAGVKALSEYDPKSKEYKTLKRALQAFWDFKKNVSKSGKKDGLVIVEDENLEEGRLAITVGNFAQTKIQVKGKWVNVGKPQLISIQIKVNPDAWDDEGLPGVIANEGSNVQDERDFANTGKEHSRWDKEYTSLEA